MGERIVVVVPMIGTGKPGDPIRPKYADPGPKVPMIGQPIPPEPKKLSASERFEAEKLRIGAYSYVLSDDGKRAIVEFVAKDRAAFAEILKDSKVSEASVQSFEKAKLLDSLADLQKVKKDFHPSMLRTPGY